MKLYGGKLIRKGVEKRVSGAVESRDAILWDVDSIARRARVKIQGSAEFVIAYYPENWQSAPAWLKPGNAVRISHTGGVRGRIELVGNGTLIPTPVSGAAAPTPATAVDTILSGLTLQACGGMYIAVKIGTVRFSGTTYASGYFTTDSNLYADSEIYADTIAAVKAVNAAPAAGTYRYDLIVIGSDLVVDYVAGTASTSPAIPATPSGHLLLGWLLVTPGTTSIAASDINAGYVAARETSLTMTIADSDLAWAELSTTVTVAISDQYGNAIGTASMMSLEIINGNGTVSVGGSSSTSKVMSYVSGSSIAFTYTRDQLDPGDKSPMLKATLDGKGIATIGAITLRNSSGDIM